MFISLFSFGQTDKVYYGVPEIKKERPDEAGNDAWKDRLIWGGNLQAWLGNPTFILLTPTIGFIPLENFNVGVGAVYNYISYNSYYGKYTQSIFGGHTYARYIIQDSYFLQVQYDKLRQPDLFSSEPNAKRWIDYVLVGGGFRQSISDKLALNTSVMYNVTPNPLSIYPSRVIIQFGITGNF
jgi:hypothetical protein